MKISAYYVKGCKLDNKNIYNGYVLNIDDEHILDSIKRKTGYKDKSLLCELTNEGFDYDKVSIDTVPITELSIGDFARILYACNSYPKLT